jgi:hypothetical protein
MDIRKKFALQVSFAKIKKMKHSSFVAGISLSRKRRREEGYLFK